MAWPFGFTVPTSFAAFALMLEAEPVETEGGRGRRCCPVVVKLLSEPTDVPAELTAKIR